MIYLELCKEDLKKMRILVLSDTHGDISRACQVYHILQKQGQVDLIIHCGDYYKDAIHMSERLGASIVWVKGNTDGSFDENGYNGIAVFVERTVGVAVVPVDGCA